MSPPPPQMKLKIFHLNITKLLTMNMKFKNFLSFVQDLCTLMIQIEKITISRENVKKWTP